MTQITHEQARRLVQFSLDGLLQSAEKTMLAAHLQDCRECRIYAGELREVERVLLPLMKRQWNNRPIPLSVPLLVQGKTSKTSGSYLLATRTAVIGIMVAALFFGAWQFVQSGPSLSNQLTLAVPPMPTPSLQEAPSTSTRITFENCEQMLYLVRGNDTLEGIAERFSISKDELILINRLQTDEVSVAMELWIPVCHSTPTGTVNPATFTTTYTPKINPTTSTPGG